MPTQALGREGGVLQLQAEKDEDKVRALMHVCVVGIGWLDGWVDG